MATVKEKDFVEIDYTARTKEENSIFDTTQEEVAKIIEAQMSSGRAVSVGFNHRFHPAMLEVKKICLSGEFGKLLYVRARYGHGGRLARIGEPFPSR